MVKKLLEKLPFFNYLLRLSRYICNPDISDDDTTKEQFDHALLDTVNALGLGAALIGAFILYDGHNSYLTIVKSFNPLYVTGLCLFYGLVFSITVALLISVLAKTPLSARDSAFKLIFYEMFAHSLRFYAAMTFFLTPMVIHAAGKIFSDGMTTMSAAFSQAIFWLILIPITLLWFPIRLFVNPMYRYLLVSKLKPLVMVTIIAIAYIGTEANQVFTPGISEKLVNKKELCAVFKAGKLYNNLDSESKLYGENLLCGEGA